MLHLQSESQSRWLKQVQGNLREILIDHAHCEYKAAATAMSLIGAYVDCEELTREMAVIVQEELEHFHMVLDLLKRRNIRFRRLRPGDYGKRLNAMVRSDEPNRAVDRLLVAGLIEARSCERFKLLREHIDDKELADFYGSLFESEARHHTTYVRLAKLFQDAEMVRLRLEELSAAESEIIAEGHPLARMHS
jgi:tRNA-(ms[2]io[6]A)-hydroxylase